MRYIVSLSGGVPSAVAAERALGRWGIVVFITAYKIEYKSPITGKSFATSHWLGDGAYQTLDEAKARVRQISGYRPAASAWTERAWLYGGRPWYVIDNLNKSAWPIGGLEGLINSKPSDYF